MRDLLARCWRWLTVGRHIAALTRRGLAIVPRPQYDGAASVIASAVRWSARSGALNDGVPRRTRKHVRLALRAVALAYPGEVTQ